MSRDYQSDSCPLEIFDMSITERLSGYHGNIKLHRISLAVQNNSALS